MNKAEQRADVYAKSRQKLGYDYCHTFDAVKYGYLQAEKDLELTWEDMRKIVEITMIIDGEFVESTDGMEAQEYWEETLRRFLEQREKK